MMRDLVRDLRYAARMFLRRRAFTIIALLSLGLGISAAISVFSIVNAALLRSLPFEQPDRLFQFAYSIPKSNLPEFTNMSVPDFLSFREQNKTLEGVVGYYVISKNLSDTGEPERVEGVEVTSRFLQILGIQPIMGRAFLPEENKKANNHQTILSYSLWQRRFNGDPAIIGKTIMLDSVAVTVVGVLPSDFRLPRRTDLLIPLPEDGDDMAYSPGNMILKVVGRLRKDATPEQARADLPRVLHQIPRLSSFEIFGNLKSFHEAFVGNFRSPLLILFGAVVFVLMIAGINTTNLLLVVAIERRREIAMRSALGANPLRVVRQILTENLILSLAAWTIGLIAAYWGIDLLIALVPENIARVIGKVSIDKPVLSFSLLGAFVIGLFFGLTLMFQASRKNLHAFLQEGGIRSSMGLRVRWARNALVISEIALAFCLMIAAGLMTQSLVKTLHVEPGFDPRSLLTVRIEPPSPKYSRESAAIFFQSLLQRLKALPGAESVSVTDNVPLESEFGGYLGYSVVGEQPAPANEYMADFSRISPGYFETMRIPILKGRDFTDRDDSKAPPVIVVNEAFVRKHWPSGNPLGKKISTYGGDHEVVGIVKDMRDKNLKRETEPRFYLHHLQDPSYYLTIAIRVKGSPMGLVGGIRKELRQMDPTISLSDIREMQDIVSGSVAMQRLMAALSSSFSILAVILATIGIYGVMSYSVKQRTHEIGVRIAMGAQRRDIIRMVVGQGVVLIVIGLVIGLAGAFALTRLIASQLYGVKATDPWTFAGVTILLGAVALLACYIPARRATKIDPMEVLRWE